MERAVQFDLTLHAMMFMQTGIPMLYSGDELAQVNDYSYKDDPKKAGDSCYLHRGKLRWEQSEHMQDLHVPAYGFYYLEQRNGEKTDNSDKSLLLYRADRGFSGNPYEMGKRDRTYSMDSLPQEYSSFGTGDYRITSFRVQNRDGSQAVELRYNGYYVQEGKYAIPGLPAVYAENGEAQTLIIRLKDSYSGLEVELYYGILEEMDIITRAVKITNQGTDRTIVPA